MNTATDPKARIAELEDELKLRDEKIKELRKELEEARDLVDQMREHLEDSNGMIEQWIYAFDMTQNEAGHWTFAPAVSQMLHDLVHLIDHHEKLLRDWNRFVTKYNRAVAPQPLGRPLAASEAQVKDVLSRRKKGGSLRAIAVATNLSRSTVRTIVGKDQGTDRASKRANLLRKREFDRQRAADYRARKKARDLLPKEITETRKRGDELVRAVKGLGKL
jgi:Helix-turn-helix domain of resolvase